MSARFGKVAVIDSNKVANEIMRDIVDIDTMERTLKTELSSVDLFKIDCAILSSLRNTEDFSRDLLKQLESGFLETLSPPKDILQDIQMNTMIDITSPIKDMFDDMAIIVSEELMSL